MKVLRVYESALERIKGRLVTLVMDGRFKEGRLNRTQNHLWKVGGWHFTTNSLVDVDVKDRVWPVLVTTGRDPT